MGELHLEDDNLMLSLEFVEFYCEGDSLMLFFFLEALLLGIVEFCRKDDSLIFSEAA